MEANNIFSFSRLYLLMRRQVFSNGKSLLIAFGGVSGFLLVISLLVAHFNAPALGGLKNLYLTIMFIGGYIFTSNIYSDLHQMQRSYNYLTLPVSVSERLFSNWLISAILFPLISVLAMALIILLSNLVTKFTIDMAPIQGIFSSSTFTAVKVYIITQSIFLLGATYFRKNNFLKTLLAVFLLGLVINLYTGFLGWGLFNGFKTSAIMFDNQQMPASFENLFMKQIPDASRFVFNYLMLPFFLLTTWFSIKERQV
jgi:hypothetical protein